MKRFLLLLVTLWMTGIAGAQTLPDTMYFRAMNDEMQRALQELRLKEQAQPYYIAYWLFDETRLTVLADMGSLAPQVYDPESARSLWAKAFVSVGSDKEDNLGFDERDPQPLFRHARHFPDQIAPGYDAIRQHLWGLTDQAYVKAVDLYKQKQAYKQKKNITQTLPDVVPATPVRWTEEITPFRWPDMERLQQDVQQISALGKKLSFVESFQVKLYDWHNDLYFLNSRGAFLQYMLPFRYVYLKAIFRQPNGKKSLVNRPRKWHA